MSVLAKSVIHQELSRRLHNGVSVYFRIFDVSLLLPQPTVTPSPPPVSQPAPAGNHSPHLPAQQSPAAPPEPSRKAGQNFKCLWQSCKRYVLQTEGPEPLCDPSAELRSVFSWCPFVSSLGGLKRRLRCFTTRQHNTVERMCTGAIVSGRVVILSPGRDCPSSHIYRWDPAASRRIGFVLLYQ